MPASRLRARGPTKNVGKSWYWDTFGGVCGVYKKDREHRYNCNIMLRQGTQMARKLAELEQLRRRALKAEARANRYEKQLALQPDITKQIQQESVWDGMQRASQMFLEDLLPWQSAAYNLVIEMRVTCELIKSHVALGQQTHLRVLLEEKPDRLALLLSREKGLRSDDGIAPQMVGIGQDLHNNIQAYLRGDQDALEALLETARIPFGFDDEDFKKRINTGGRPISLGKKYLARKMVLIRRQKKGLWWTTGKTIFEELLTIPLEDRTPGQQEAYIILSAYINPIPNGDGWHVHDTRGLGAYLSNLAGKADSAGNLPD